MILNAEQIQTTLNSLKEAHSEQVRILNEARTIICVDLESAWKCKAQEAYVDAFIGLEKSVLSQINDLIQVFGTALEQSVGGLYEVDVNLSTMNATAITG